MSEKMKVLIVEDDSDVLFSYKTQLEMMEIIDKKYFETKIATSKKEAENYLNENFDYVVLDGLEGDCFELYKKINANKKIILSGNQFILNKCKEEGIESISKPCSLSKILK